MGFKVFLDANILLDFFFKRKEHYALSRELMIIIAGGRLKGYATPSILHITGYWLNKDYGNAKAKQLLQTLLEDITVIDCSHAVAKQALHAKINDIEDALQYYTALEHQLDYFISRDKQLKKLALEELPVYAIQDFLKLIA